MKIAPMVLKSFIVTALLFGAGAQGAAEKAPLSSCGSPCPAVRVSTRPRMVLIPRLGIYYAPDSQYNLYLVNKIWFYYYDGKWYRSHTYEGSWQYVPFSKVPEVLKNLPQELLTKEKTPEKKETKPSKKKKR